MRAPTFRPSSARWPQSTASPCSTAWSTASTAARTASARSRSRWPAARAPTLEADGLAVSGGWNPSVGLTSQHRGRPKWRDDIAAFVPDGAPAGMVAAGAANGAFSLADCLREGHAAGAAAAADLGFGKSAGEAPSLGRQCAYSLTPLWHVTGKKKAFVDFQNDVTASDVALAALRRLPVGRASEALHHARHGDRPGQDLERPGPRHHGGADRPLDPRDRHDDLPPALCAGRHRRAGRPSSRREFPCDAADAVASLGGRARRDLRRHRPVEARAMVSASRARRTGWNR